MKSFMQDLIRGKKRKKDMKDNIFLKFDFILLSQILKVLPCDFGNQNKGNGWLHARPVYFWIF